MSDKKRFGFGFGLIAAAIGTILSLGGLVFYKLFPKMKEGCQGMMDKCCSPDKTKECCPSEKGEKK